MSRLKTPQQKKRASYAHDRVEGGEYPHADRKNRPRLKALAQRQHRRTAKQILASKLDDVPQLQERSRLGWTKNTVRLAAHLLETQMQRIERQADNIFRKGYGAATHARFRRVVQSWMQSGSEQSASLADFYRTVMHPHADPRSNGRASLSHRRNFLRQFFNREPHLKIRFENWIALFKHVDDVD